MVEIVAGESPVVLANSVREIVSLALTACKIRNVLARRKSSDRAITERICAIMSASTHRQFGSLLLTRPQMKVQKFNVLNKNVDTDQFLVQSFFRALN